MARTNHVVQHRPRRESKEIEMKAELQQLRSELQRIKRENARLRREYEKLQNTTHSSYTEEAPEEPAASVPEPVKDGCPNGCGVEMKRIPTPFKVLVVCPECKWRKTIDP